MTRTTLANGHPTEAQEARTLMVYCDWHAAKYPQLRLLFHVPNEARRSPATANLLKATGMRAGVPDYILPVPRGPHHGLAIELKAMGGKPSKEQARWLQDLRDQGWAAYCCWGAADAWAKIREYLDLEVAA
jgi:hypothetical protein